MRRAGILILAIFCLAECLAATNDDFDVSGNYTQLVQIIGAKTIVIRCYCPSRNVEQVPDAIHVELRITGNYSSVGYHGAQAKPKDLARAQLEFVERRDGNAVVVESKERTYIHHAFIINQLVVRAPANIEVRFEPISVSALEGRQVR